MILTGLLGSVLGVFQSLFQLLQRLAASRLVDMAVAAEIEGISLYPHLQYGIVSGGGIVENISMTRTHIGPVATYLGLPKRVITVVGGARRSSIAPYIPMVSSYAIKTKSVVVGTCGDQNYDGGKKVYYATVNYRGYQIKPILSPIVSLESAVLDNIKYITNLVYTGLALGPPALVSLSKMYEVLISASQASSGGASDSKKSDFYFAMNPAALQVYDRVE